MRKLLFVFIGAIFLFSNGMSFAASKSTPKKWTFIIFMNGNNNLDYFTKTNIIDMEKVGSNDEVNVLVQWASMASGKAVRMLVEKSHDHSKVISPVLQDLGAVDMGSDQELESFIRWSVENYPAEHYFISIWNHGNGWKKRLTSTPNRDISYDEISGNKITTEQLGTVMAHAAQMIGHKVDIYGSDACLMGMAEVANEMSDSVNYFVGSQEVEPGTGWAYEPLLSSWLAKQNATPVEVANILVETYVDSYQGGVNGNQEVTFSAYDLSKFDALNQAVKKLGANIREVSPESRRRILDLAEDVQSFYFNQDYVDLTDLLDIFSASPVPGIEQQHIDAVRAAINDFVIANKTTPDYTRAHGLSIWLPLSKHEYKGLADRYQNLQFNKNTQWGDTLSFLVQGA